MADQSQTIPIDPEDFGLGPQEAERGTPPVRSETSSFMSARLAPWSMTSFWVPEQTQQEVGEFSSQELPLVVSVWATKMVKPIKS